MMKHHSHLDFQLLLLAVLELSVVLKTEQNSHIEGILVSYCCSNNINLLAKSNINLLAKNNINLLSDGYEGQKS